MIEPPGIPANAQARSALPNTGLLPDAFDPAYTEGAAKTFIMSSAFVGERPALPMIDLALSKEAALAPHFWGLLYDTYGPTMQEDGVPVFLQGYENRGPDNERKRIYFSALTPDLYQANYAAKVGRFLDRLFAPENEGQPLMRRYLDSYYDLYWDLHVGVTGADIPPEITEIGQCFVAALGFFYPTDEIMHQNYLRVRELREPLRQWIDARVQAVKDGTVPDADKTMVHYWLTNGQEGENFRRKDIVFECFHNFLAFSQWGNALYNIIARLDQTQGEAAVREWFARTMADPDRTDGTAFSALDRFVMELFRVISPNTGSFSVLQADRQFIGPGYSAIITPHAETSSAPHFWPNPHQFDPDRYLTAPTSDQHDEASAQQLGFAYCPFTQKSYPVKDGRDAVIANSGFGAVYGVVAGKPQPVLDYAGYAPFGFGYRRCAGELLTIDFFKDMLRKVWQDKLTFSTLDLPHAETLPVGPRTLLQDNIGFARPRSGSFGKP